MPFVVMLGDDEERDMGEGPRLDGCSGFLGVGGVENSFRAVGCWGSEPARLIWDRGAIRFGLTGGKCSEGDGCSYGCS